MNTGNSYTKRFDPINAAIIEPLPLNGIEVAESSVCIHRLDSNEEMLDDFVGKCSSMQLELLTPGDFVWIKSSRYSKTSVAPRAFACITSVESELTVFDGEINHKVMK